MNYVRIFRPLFKRNIQTEMSGFLAHYGAMSDDRRYGGLSVAERLKELRERTRPKMSARAVAARLGIAATSYSYYEAGFKKPYLPRDLAEKLATIFAEGGVPEADVLALSGEATAEPGEGVESISDQRKIDHARVYEAAKDYLTVAREHGAANMSDLHLHSWAFDIAEIAVRRKYLNKKERMEYLRDRVARLSDYREPDDDSD